MSIWNIIPTYFWRVANVSTPPPTRVVYTQNKKNRLESSTLPCKTRGFPNEPLFPWDLCGLCVAQPVGLDRTQVLVTIRGGGWNFETPDLWGRVEDGPMVLFFPLGMGRPLNNQIITRWWQLKYILIFTPKIGEMIQFDEHIFQLGWNHRLEYNQPDNKHLI